MIKEFEINDILNAVNSISKIEKKKTNTTEKNDSTNKGMLGINIKAGFKPMPSWLFMVKVIKNS